MSKLWLFKFIKVLKLKTKRNFDDILMLSEIFFYYLQFYCIFTSAIFIAINLIKSFMETVYNAQKLEYYFVSYLAVKFLSQIQNRCMLDARFDVKQTSDTLDSANHKQHHCLPDSIEPTNRVSVPLINYYSILLKQIFTANRYCYLKIKLLYNYDCICINDYYL